MKRSLTGTALGGMVVLGLLVWASRATPPADDRPGTASGHFPRSPEESAAAAQVLDGFSVELFAADPHLASPVAMTFDADGQVYVAEMLDYPIIRTPGMFGPFPEGQIRRLRVEGGRVVGSTVFATALNAPTSVVPYDGGVLVSAAPDILFLKDTDGDGHADVRQILLTGFDDSQDLYRLNSLFWGPDGWIYARGVGNTPIHWGDDLNGPPLSTGNMSFRFRPRERAFEVVSGMSSCFGLTTDDWGHLFFTNSANHVYQVVLDDRYLRRNPYLAAPPLYREISDHGGVAPIHRISPPQPWRVERSEIWEKTGLTKKYFGDIEPRQDYMTAVCGPLIYRESRFPPEFHGNYFCCEAVSSLVHRDALSGPGPVLTAHRADEGREFFASRDNWCAPVYLEAGPDGAMYVVDMYRQIIEHAGADGGRDVPNVPLEVLQKYGLRAGSTMGRIYRVTAAGTPGRPAPPPHLSRATPRELAETLASPDAWWRTTAQRLILEAPSRADLPAITAVVRSADAPAARVQALWTLDALHRLEPALLLEALRHPAPGVRENALRLAESQFATSLELAAAALAMTDDPDATVRFQLALSLGALDSLDRPRALAALIRAGGDEPYLRAAVLSTCGDGTFPIYGLLAEGSGAPGVDAWLAEAARSIGSRLDPVEITRVLELAAAAPRERDAAILQNLARGIQRRGRKDLDIASARTALGSLRKSESPSVRAAATELAGLMRTLSPEERIERVAAGSTAARDEARSLEERVQAVETLGSVDSDEARTALAPLLHPRNPEPLQQAALQALAAQTSPEVIDLLADAWAGFSPAVQARAAEVALGRRTYTKPLLEAISAGRVPATAFDANQRARLLASADPAIAELARTLLGDLGRGLDPSLFESRKAALSLQGNPIRGRGPFSKLCVTCHKVGGEGADVGPNLASVHNRPTEQLLRDILYPSMAVAPQYHQYVIATNSGQLVAGLLVGSNATSYTIRRQGGEEVTLLRADVEELRDNGISLMPEKLLDDLSDQEVADLLEFVRRAS